jgi:hypothetical protein
MIPLILPGLSRAAPYIVVAVLSLGCIFYAYSRGHNAGEAKVQALRDAEYIVMAKNVNERLLENAALANNYDLLKWNHDAEIRKRLAADNKSADLARRLREYYASDASRALSSLAESAARIDGASGTGAGADDSGTGVDLAIQGVLTACRADSIKLQGWQAWWGDVVNAASTRRISPES